MFLIISGYAHKFNNYIYYLTFLISLVYIFYRLFLAFCAIIGYFYIIRKGKFIVRNSNSHVDLLISCLKFLGITSKTVVRAGMGGGFTSALCKELDDYLIEKNKRGIFIPAIHKAAATAGIDKPIVKLIDLIADILEVEDIVKNDKD